MTEIVMGRIIDLNNVLISYTKNNDTFFMKIISSCDVVRNVARNIFFNFPIFENQMIELKTKDINVNNDIHPMSLVLVIIDDVPYFYILPKRFPGKKIVSIRGETFNPTQPVTNYNIADIQDENLTIFKFSVNGKAQRELYSGVDYDVEVNRIRPDCILIISEDGFRETVIVKMTETTFPGTLIYKKDFEKYKINPDTTEGQLIVVEPIGKFQFTQLFNYNVINNCKINCNLYESILQIGKANFIKAGNCGSDKTIVPILFSNPSLCFLNRDEEILPCSVSDFCGNGDCYGICEDIDQICKIVDEKPICVQINENDISTVVIISIIIVIFIILVFIILISK